MISSSATSSQPTNSTRYAKYRLLSRILSSSHFSHLLFARICPLESSCSPLSLSLSWQDKVFHYDDSLYIGRSVVQQLADRVLSRDHYRQCTVQVRDRQKEWRHEHNVSLTLSSTSSILDDVDDNEMRQLFHLWFSLFFLFFFLPRGWLPSFFIRQILWISIRLSSCHIITQIIC